MNGATKMVIAIIGGTGDLGSGLASGWAKAGYAVVLGSRSRDKAIDQAARYKAGVVGEDNVGAARKGDIVVVAVPFSSHTAILEEIKAEVQGKIVIDAVVPLVPPKVSTVQLPPDGSAALAAKRVLGDGVRVVSAFHNIGAAKLRAGTKAEGDVLVFSDDREAQETAIQLAEVVASRGVSGGALANSIAAEAMTSVLIWINRQYKVSGAGIIISGLQAKDPS
jgi:NADPH-dependent F420 reductase